VVRTPLEVINLAFEEVKGRFVSEHALVWGWYRGWPEASDLHAIETDQQVPAVGQIFLEIA